jgi:hypothetical protein
VLLDELREELLAADMFRFERALPVIRVGRNEAEDGALRKRVVRWTIYLVSAGDLTGKQGEGRADRLVKVALPIPLLPPVEMRSVVSVEVGAGGELKVA